MSNTGHGWVTPRDDGMKARCGGPGLCPVCQRDKAALEAAQLAEPADSEQAWARWWDIQHGVLGDVDARLDRAGDGKSDQFMAALTSSVIEHLAERQRRYIKLPHKDAENVT